MKTSISRTQNQGHQYYGCGADIAASHLPSSELAAGVRPPSWPDPERPGRRGSAEADPRLLGTPLAAIDDRVEVGKRGRAGQGTLDPARGQPPLRLLARKRGELGQRASI